MEGDFVWKGKKRHLFLFNNQLVCTSVKKGNHKIKWACTLLNATLEFKKEMCIQNYFIIFKKKNELKLFF